MLSGVLIPLGVPGTDFANFVGYVLWSVWLVGFAVVVWRAPAADLDTAGRQMVEVAGGHLGSAGVMDADKQNGRHV